MRHHYDRHPEWRLNRISQALGFIPLLVPVLSLGISTAQAATFTVANLNNDGSGSLRQAIANANNQPGADTIQFQSGLTGTLAVVGTLEIKGDLDLKGPGAEVLEILGNKNTVFSVASTSIVSISDLAITNGDHGIVNQGKLTVARCDVSKNFGDGILNYGDQSNLDLVDSIISENNGHGVENGHGSFTSINSILSKNGQSGIANYGSITFRDGVISYNKDHGIYNYGSIDVNNSAIVGNQTSGNGGGVSSFSGEALTITNSTISGNEGRCGGGVYIIWNTNSEIYNNTISGNSATRGGGICIFDSTILSLINSTLSGNNASSQGGGAYIYYDSTLFLGNSLVSGNRTSSGGNTGPEVFNMGGTLVSKGHNLFGQNGSAGLTYANPGASDIVLSGPVATAISPLADNGGPTQTHLPVKNSPAIDAGDNTLIPTGVTSDQRGEKRISNGTVDIGAVEVASTKKFKLSVSRTGNGTVISKPAGINCGTTCTATFESGKKVKLTATPSDGWTFTGWDGACAEVDACEIKMNAAQAVTANFSPALPDLLVTGITLVPAAPIANDTFNVKVKVKNQGTSTADAGTLSVWASEDATQACGDSGDQSLAVGTLAPGASKTVTVKGLKAISAGPQTLRAFLDSACVTEESDETNNQSTKTYQVRSNELPDLVVTEVKLTPVSPAAGGTFTAKVTVENQGTAAGDGGYIDVWADQSKKQGCGDLGEAWAEIGNLAAGETRTIALPASLRAGSAGSKTLRVFADSWCETEESKEGNNQFTKDYRVK